MKTEENVQKINITVEEDKLFEGAARILEIIRPLWAKDKIEYKLLTDGITNKLVRCLPEGENEAETVLIRMYGNKTDLLIDRKAETRNVLLLNKLHLAPQLYAIFQNGLAYQYVPGSVLTRDTVNDPSIYRLVAIRMAQMHKVVIPNVENRVPCLWTKMQNFLNLIPDKFSDKRKQKKFEDLRLPNKQKLQKEKGYLEKRLGILDSPVVFGHNDLLLGNVIYTKSANEVNFIDYEYACYNYQAYDIGNHFAEFAGVDEVDYSYYPDKNFQFNWLKIYLQEFTSKEVSDHEVEKLYVEVNQFALAAHLFWGIWCLIQAEYSYIDFDFLKYGQQRLGEYFNKKTEFLSLKSRI